MEVFFSCIYKLFIKKHYELKELLDLGDRKISFCYIIFCMLKYFVIKTFLIRKRNLSAAGAIIRMARTESCTTNEVIPEINQAQKRIRCSITYSCQGYF